ncbi:MAG: hypothetical protein P8O03_11280 [Ilumatobacter sp.]|nr:hypothetical protein [bacterium]MDG1266894.1 hypothetical protein [Ilumatobacter sp.]NKB41875.1 hypothetical protein [Ilumatobacter sp.]
MAVSNDTRRTSGYSIVAQAKYTIALHTPMMDAAGNAALTIKSTTTTLTEAGSLSTGLSGRNTTITIPWCDADVCFVRAGRSSGQVR